MKLSDNFYLYEFEKSPTAVRLGIDNKVPDDLIPNLVFLSENVLQPVRNYFVSETKQGKSVTVNSGYRCLELNRALKSKDSSQHITGCAADIEIARVDNYAIARWIKDNLEFDQLILEHYTGEPSSGWVHVSINPEGNNRGRCLTIGNGVTVRGLVKVLP